MINAHLGSYLAISSINWILQTFKPLENKFQMLFPPKTVLFYKHNGSVDDKWLLCTVSQWVHEHVEEFSLNNRGDLWE